MVLVVALTRVGTEVLDEDERVTVQAPTPPAASKATATATNMRRRLRTSVLNPTAVPFVERGCTAPARRFPCAAGNFMHDNWESSVRDSHPTSGCLLYTSDAADEEDSVDLG